ncbi:MAG: hypothetical protein EBZ67_15690 [Chitinophagia bacterium]|jgi:hypothetical protein|nr:hypothetical protein [Chitinophagia bacterium]
MAIRYNAATLGRIEKIVEDAGYTLRYERGTFQSGYCILEARKVVVLNRFLQTEGRINTIIELMASLDIDQQTLSVENRRFLQELTGKTETVSRD